MKLGIDFGSAYSTVSRYDEQNDKAEPLTLEEGGSASIPSSVSVSRKGTVLCGASARNLVGTANVYEAFKMFLVESDQEMKRKTSFTEKLTPSCISKYFLEYMLTGVINRYSSQGEAVEEVVVCVPEVWKNKINTLDGCNILREVIANEVSLPGGTKVEHVKVVTEPEAASAFFAHNYEVKTGQKFNGYLLLIDYGGGTLDITLTEVFSNGERSMEIGYRESGGVGENHPDKNGNYVVGNAGFAYIRKVTELAIIESGILAENEKIDFESMEFRKAERLFEDMLKDPSSVQNIEMAFAQFGRYDDFCEILDEEDETLGVTYYLGEEIVITYKQLYRAYTETIEGVLANELEKINKKAERYLGVDPCSIEAAMRDDFKIALVGGFSSFYLVRKQIENIYNFDSNTDSDKRIKNINTGQSEQAISLGAALLASKRVVLQKTAHYSIGLFTKDYASKNHLAYGIRYHQIVDTNVPYYLLFSPEKGDTPANRVKYASIRNQIKNFVVEFSPNEKRGFRLKLKQEMLDRLSGIQEGGLWCCGFSMDENDVISFHITPAPGIDPIYKETVIKLESYSNMFEMTAGEEVYADEI